MKKETRNLFILGGLAAVLFFMRKRVAQAGRIVVTEAQKGLFEMAIPERAKPYADVIQRVAKEVGVDPFALVAIGERESRWGKALDAYMTGDKTGRTGSWLKTSGVAVVDSLPKGWSYPKAKDGSVKPGPYAIPADGKGWGRGIMQLDYVNALKINWADPVENIRASAKHLKADMDWFANKGLTGNAQLQAAMAAYNTGAGRVWESLTAKPPRNIDSTTTGGDYSKDTLTMMAMYASKFTSALT